MRRVGYFDIGADAMLWLSFDLTSWGVGLSLQFGIGYFEIWILCFSASVILSRRIVPARPKEVKRQRVADVVQISKRADARYYS